MLRRFGKFVLQPSELLEKYTSGWGPGGQKVNKATNCVQLKHVPTGIIVKVHDNRDLNINRKIALKRLTEKVEFELFQDESKLGKQIAKARKRKAKARSRALKKLDASEDKTVSEDENY